MKSQTTRRAKSNEDEYDTDFVLAPIANDPENDIFYQDIDALVSNGSFIGDAESQAADAYSSNDTKFITITSLNGTDKVLADVDGNIYYGKKGNGTFFESVYGFVEGDGARYFHYYSDTMDAYNVSRLRLSDQLAIPSTADLITLAPVNYNNNNKTSDVFLALDTEGSIFFPVTCDIQDQLSKAFLVADLKSGLEKLLDPKLRYTVTGGIVQKCYYLPWAGPAGSENALIPTSKKSA